ncbi:hypothetical protein HC256_006650 [Beauveria bassiana]|nr:hypothetical protein HC256_006650 [Beauveria bassiana]
MPSAAVNVPASAFIRPSIRQQRRLQGCLHYATNDENGQEDERDVAVPLLPARLGLEVTPALMNDSDIQEDAKHTDNTIFNGVYFCVKLLHVEWR